MSALVLSALPLAAAPVELAFEDAEGRQVMFTFAEDRTAADALVIETRRFGNPGAAIMIWIDQSTDPLATMILDAADCSYDDDGAACRLAVAATAPTTCASSRPSGSAARRMSRCATPTSRRCGTTSRSTASRRPTTAEA
jgi:hypothetical protein